MDTCNSCVKNRRNIKRHKYIVLKSFDIQKEYGSFSQYVSTNYKKIKLLSPFNKIRLKLTWSVGLKKILSK